jgi:N-formylglutamate deformylase
MSTVQGDPPWLTVRRGTAPLLLSIPHAGTELLHVSEQVCSPWLARLDADWWVDQLYDFARELDVTVLKTAISRTVIDVNRDPQAGELYPGMASTELVPTTTFDGVALYSAGRQPTGEEQALRRVRYYEPYHATLRAELHRLRQRHGSVVLYDAHSIRSRVPRLFEGELPLFNIGTFGGRSCSPQLTGAVAAACHTLPPGMQFSCVVDGRFKGGYITRSYGQPAAGVHAIQMELACRAYLDEPSLPLDATNWPPPFAEQRARAVQNVLRAVLMSCLEFAGATP